MFISELGGPAVHSGVVTRGLPGAAGRFSVEQVRAAYRVPYIHSPRTRVVWVENTHNASGGRIWPLEEIDELRSLCDELGLRFHLDGARLLNAAVGERGGRRDDRPPLRHRHALSLQGPRLPARRAPCRLRRGDDERAPHEAPLRRRHAPGGDRRRGRCLRPRPPRRPARRRPRARQAARARARRGGPRGRSRPGRDELRPARCRAAVEGGGDRGCWPSRASRLSATIHPSVLRAVTHLDVGDADIEGALEAIPRALGARVRA